MFRSYSVNIEHVWVQVIIWVYFFSALEYDVTVQLASIFCLDLQNWDCKPVLSDPPLRCFYNLFIGVFLFIFNFNNFVVKESKVIERSTSKFCSSIATKSMVQPIDDISTEPTKVLDVLLQYNHSTFASFEERDFCYAYSSITPV